MFLDCEVIASTPKIVKAHSAVTNFHGNTPSIVLHPVEGAEPADRQGEPDEGAGTCRQTAFKFLSIITEPRVRRQCETLTSKISCRKMSRFQLGSIPP